MPNYLPWKAETDHTLRTTDADMRSSCHLVDTEVTTPSREESSNPDGEFFIRVI